LRFQPLRAVEPAKPAEGTKRRGFFLWRIFKRGGKR